MGLTFAILTGLLVGLLRSEVDAWLPWLVRKLHAVAVGRLPANLRARYHEEWLAHLNDTPGVLTKVAVAVSLIYAGTAIALREKSRSNRGIRDALRSACDRGCALVLLIIYAPVFAIIAIAIKATGGDRVFIRQNRMGAEYKIIPVHRFATFRNEGHVGQAISSDNLTVIGRFLRRTGMYELPMIWGIVTGRLSFVGPQPTRHILANAASDEDCALLLGERPGMIDLRRLIEAPSEEISVKLQAEYCRRRTFLSDLALIFRYNFSKAALFRR